MNHQINIQVRDELSQFSAEEINQWRAWNVENNPFCDPCFFSSLEKSNCIGKNTGWNPVYFTLTGDQKLLALVIGFVKTHSYGEYIFDWQWAHAYDNYQIPYYPKLTVAIPYSPVSAPKFFGDSELIKNVLLPQLMSFTKQYSLSGIHFLFTQNKENKILEEKEFKTRSSLQYHWINPQVDDFESYLATLKKNRRKTIKRERRVIKESPLTIKRIPGTQVTQEDIDFFYQCYSDTIEKKASMGYLNYDFFKNLFQSQAQNIVLCMALDHQHQPIASSLFLFSDTTLFGRYWGCQKDIEFLHFELCIYQGIELAIEKGLRVFEAGAQGEHKRLRGFTPVLTTSSHYIEHPQFRKAIFDFIDGEKDQLDEISKELALQNSLKAKV